MKELGMNDYLAVGAGSQNESLMSVMEYKGNPNPGPMDPDLYSSRSMENSA